MKFGTYFAYWTQEWKGDFPYFVKKVKDIGFDVLEVGAAQVVDMSDADLENLKNIAAENAIQINCCIGLPKQYDVSSADAAVRKDGIAYLKNILKKMKTLDSHYLSGLIFTYWPYDYSQPVDKERGWSNAVASVKEVIKTAEEYDINYCAEIVNRFESYIMNTAAEGVEFCKQVGSPKSKLLLDVFHMNIEEDFLGDAIRLAGDYMAELHIGECNRKVPGKGHMPWDDIAQGLWDINFDGPVVMEPFVKMGGQVGLDIKVFRDLSDNADEAKMDADIKGALHFTKSKFLR